MKARLPIFVLSAICLTGCSIPVPTGSRTIRGNPVDKKEIEDLLRVGSNRTQIIQTFGEPSWTAFDGQVVCYEGMLDHGTSISTSEAISFGLLVPILIYAGQGYWGPTDFFDTEPRNESRRVLMFFNHNDELDLIEMYSSQDQLEYTKLVDLIEFSKKCWLPETLLNENTLNREHGSEPAWKSADGKVVFYGSILPDYGEINGIFIRFDDNGRVTVHKRGHFRSFAIREQFRDNLDRLMMEKMRQPLIE